MTEPNTRRPRRISNKERIEKLQLSSPQRFPIENLVLQLREVPLIFGQLIEGEISLSETETSIKHSLGKEALGYLIFTQDAPAVIYRVPLTFTPPADEIEKKEQARIRNSTIILKASEPVTVRLWVFSQYKKPEPPPPKRRREISSSDQT